MREDLQEELQKMFPRGFIIVHVNKDNSISYFMNNPEYVDQIFSIEDGIKNAAETGDLE